MAGNLFELALVQLKPADWEHLERLASQFLVVEFPALRTMANPEGDQGRDSELFCPDGDPTVCLQYSVSNDWATKIKKTNKRLNKTFPGVKLIVYATNHVIGARADELKKLLLKEGRFLDVRDQRWFLERQDSHTQRSIAANEIIDRIAMPYIKEYDSRKSAISPLQNLEARTALTYIALQLHDDQQGKGLTKVCFDALVRAALRNSSNTHPVSRSDIQANVLKALPSVDSTTIEPLVDASLERLRKSVIAYDGTTDVFFLRQEESARIKARLADTAVLDSKFKSFLGVLCIEFLSENDVTVNPKDIEDLQTRIPRIIETLCLQNGEQFVTAVNAGKIDVVITDQLNTIVFNDLTANRYRSTGVGRYPQLIQHVIRAVATTDHEATRAYLKGIAMSYTLLAFLKQTPDVQKATKRIFSHGKIWLDTSVLLPLFAEQLLEPGERRTYQTIVEACSREGDELFIIRGVLDEINHHMQNCLHCLANRTEWRSHLPYLLAQYIKTGRALSGFRDWIDGFRGQNDPKEEIELYLKQEHGITVHDLNEAADEVDDRVAAAVDRLWTASHAERRPAADPAVSKLLTTNDVTMYLGVMGLRLKNPASEWGPRYWLLTKDTVAWRVRGKLKEEFPDADPKSPLLSLSFLINAIEFSPNRAGLDQSIEVRLPTILDIEFEDADAVGLMTVAEDVRKANDGLPERLIQRKVRDAITQARRHTWREEPEQESGKCDTPKTER
jgi:hypothetical protein